MELWLCQRWDSLWYIKLITIVSHIKLDRIKSDCMDQIGLDWIRIGLDWIVVISKVELTNEAEHNACSSSILDCIWLHWIGSYQIVLYWIVSDCVGSDHIRLLSKWTIQSSWIIKSCQNLDNWNLNNQKLDNWELDWTIKSYCCNRQWAIGNQILSCRFQNTINLWSKM